jgi:rubrerythrin
MAQRITRRQKDISRVLRNRKTLWGNGGGINWNRKGLSKYSKLNLHKRKEDAMDTKERLNALEIALTNEMQEREFYLKHAERTAHPLGKSMFLQIAEDELEHYDRLRQIHEIWTQNRTWPESIPLTIGDTRIKDVLKNLLDSLDEMPTGNDDDIAALKTAIAFEARAVAHYEKIRDNISDPKQKKFFDLLAHMENEHYIALRDVEQFFTDPAAWYRIKERHGLDGG